MFCCCRTSWLLSLFLLFNAVDALQGSGRVKIAVVDIDDWHCALRVDDDGPGIEQDVIDDIFEPFMTTKPAGKGTGLGLAVCHALMEAMASGCACVATRVGGVPWLLEKTGAGLTVPPGDHEALEHAIERLIDDAELRQELAARAREVINDRYRLDRLSEELVAILKAA